MFVDCYISPFTDWRSVIGEWPNGPFRNVIGVGSGDTRTSTGRPSWIGSAGSCRMRRCEGLNLADNITHNCTEADTGSTCEGSCNVFGQTIDGIQKCSNSTDGPDGVAWSGSPICTWHYLINRVTLIRLYSERKKFLALS